MTGAAVVNLGNNGAEFFGLCPVNLVMVVNPRDGEVCRNCCDIKAVNGRKFLCLGHGGSGHAGQLGIEAKEILKGNRGKRLVFALDIHALLCL